MNRPTRSNADFRDLAVEEFDTTTLMSHAAQQAIARKYEEFTIVDVDSHHYESQMFHEISDYIQDPVLRHEAKYQGLSRPGINTPDGSYQEMSGRITRYPGRAKEKTPPEPHREITLMRRWMDPMGVDIAVLFPTPMLSLQVCPRIEVEVALAQAYNRWLCENILAKDPRIKSMLYLPYNDPEGCYRTVLEFGDKPGVIGFMATATHYRGCHDNAYIKTYAAIQERGMPLGFHASFSWADHTLALTNRFTGVHSLGFTWCNMLYMTNWILNGLPERFPRLKTIWIESGLAWIPFMMQRLDNEFMMRPSDAPMLKRRPSEYMRDMYYTSQPMEMVDNREALELTMKLIKAEAQLLYVSDYPHWDMDLPSTIYDLPFLSEEAKRNILGGNALRLFNLPPMLSDTKILRRATRDSGMHKAGT